MGKKIKIIFILLLVFSLNAFSQDLKSISFNKDLSIIPTVNYVSSATIQLNPFSADFFERNSSEELGGGYGYSIGIRKKLFREDLSFGLTLEYLTIEDNELVQTLETGPNKVRLRVTEKIWVTPIEFTGYFNLPSFDENLNIYLGGGVGVYFGDRKRTIHNLESKTISKQPGFSFLVISGIEYYFNNQISSVFEIRFREGEYKVKSEFPGSTVSINGKEYNIEKNLNSRIFVDGLKLSLGIAYHF